MLMYGKEDPRVLTFNDIFNPTTAQMELSTMQQYINAVREDYYKNLEDQKNFLELNSLFTSPIAKDAENFYNMTTGGLNDLYKAAEEQGIDLLRSQQGKALIQRYIMSRPYAQLALLKQSAENAKLYQRAYGELASKGLISPDMARFIDGDLSNWDTLGSNGMWTNISPVQYKSYTDMLAPTKAMLKDEYKYLGTRGWKDIYGVSDDRVKEALNSSMSDLLAQPQMQYYLKTLFNGDKKALQDAMYQRLRASLGNEEKDNKMKEVQYEQSQANARQAREIASQERIARLKAGANGSGGGTTLYRENNWLDAMNKLGIQNPNQLLKARQTRALEVISTMPVYSTELKKVVPFAALSIKEKNKVLTDKNSNVYKKYNSSVNRFDSDRQFEIFKDYHTKGGSWKTASLALSFDDNGDQFASQFNVDNELKDSKNNTLGFKKGNNKFYTIGEVTSRTGAINKMKQRYYKENDGKRNAIKYFDTPTGKNNMIIQYERYDHKYHGYRLVRTYNESNEYIGDMWMETYDPTDWHSSSAQAHNAKANEAIGINNKSQEAPVNTIYD